MLSRLVVQGPSEVTGPQAEILLVWSRAQYKEAQANTNARATAEHDQQKQTCRGIWMFAQVMSFIYQSI